MDPGFRRDDAKRQFWAFYESIKQWYNLNIIPVAMLSSQYPGEYQNFSAHP
jgi:hypothetical protein